MASRIAMLRTAGRNMACMLGFKRWSHVTALPSPIGGAIDRGVVSPPLVLPEFYSIRDTENSNQNFVGFDFPSHCSGGSMELMAVPKRKVSRHKRGIRNGPKALKPIPVIIRCKSCGRVKLPHFYCCSGDRGDRGNTGEQNS